MVADHCLEFDSNYPLQYDIPSLKAHDTTRGVDGGKEGCTSDAVSWLRGWQCHLLCKYRHDEAYAPAKDVFLQLPIALQWHARVVKIC